MKRLYEYVLRNQKPFLWGLGVAYAMMNVVLVISAYWWEGIAMMFAPKLILGMSAYVLLCTLFVWRKYESMNDEPVYDTSAWYRLFYVLYFLSVMASGFLTFLCASTSLTIGYVLLGLNTLLLLLVGFLKVRKEIVGPTPEQT